MKSRRILILTPYLNLGGLERMILFLCKGLKKQGHWDPRVFVFESERGKLDAEFAAQNIPVRHFPKGDGFSAATVRRIARYARQNQARVIHTHDLGALIYGVLAKILTAGRLKIVHTQHSFVHIDRKKRYRTYEKIFTRFVDRLCVVSESAKQDYIALGISPDRILLVPNGVEVVGSSAPTVQTRAKDRDSWIRTVEDTQTRARLEALKDAFWVVSIGRIAKGKGQDGLIRVWNALHPSVREKLALIFIGGGSDQEATLALKNAIESAESGDRVVYAGATFHPHLALRASEVFASASRFEGMPLGPLEAAGEGSALLLSDIPGHSLFSDVAIRFRLDDEIGGARALESLYSEILNDSGGIDGFFAEYWEKTSVLRERYGVEAMAERYAALYEEVHSK